jgi:hypothetical protein
MHVADLQHYACVVFRLEEPHPHVVCVAVDTEQALAEAMWGWDIHSAPYV